MGARQRNPEPEDDDPGDPGTKVQDPILRSIRPGRDTEPSPRELFKGSYDPSREADGDPPAGRMTIEEARRRGPIGWLQLLGPGLVTGASDDDPSGIAAGGSLLTRGAVHLLWFVVPAAVLILALQVFMTYAVIFKVFKWLTVALFAYVITGFLVHPDLR